MWILYLQRISTSGDINSCLAEVWADMCCFVLSFAYLCFVHVLTFLTWDRMYQSLILARVSTYGEQLLIIQNEPFRKIYILETIFSGTIRPAERSVIENENQVFNVRKV